ncbi:MAG: 23S rRNA (uracil(1939)-C(5))-methyltransferase RlmD [Cryomorphaceae bacterium]|nr:23S rRNA (uracil(1939)-C(5))-methyltransferase RlmD [Cryomorphaceae bacterium]
MGNRKRKKEVHELDITGAGAKGKAIAHLENGKTVMIQGAVPGDRAKVLVYKQKKRYAEGKTLEILSPSPDRIEPECRHFAYCGGCKWQNLTYEAQLRFKSDEVHQNLKRIGHLQLPEAEPILPSPGIFYYRNKLEYSFSTHRWLTETEIETEGNIELRNALGFHVPGRWDRVIDIQHCHLQPEPSNAIRNFLRDYAQKNNLSFYHPYDKVGALRSLMIRTSGIGEVMVLLQFGPADNIDHQKIMDDIKAEFPQITTALYTINHKGNESLYDQEMRIANGPGYIMEEMPAFRKGDPNLKFKIGPKTFYQTNALQAEALYRIALEFLNPQPDELLYDLYTGVGTIALYAAHSVKKVIGLELIEDSIRSAIENAKRNEIDNAEFFAGDMREVLNEAFIEKHGRPDILIVDPPREGMHPTVVKTILEIQPERWVYVSCNSATQARDLALMKDSYEVVKFQPVDMFPHTHHVENIALLQRIKSND